MFEPIETLNTGEGSSLTVEILEKYNYGRRIIIDKSKSKEETYRIILPQIKP